MCFWFGEVLQIFLCKFVFLLRSSMTLGLRCVLVYIYLPKLRQEHGDYAFHSYGEMCKLVLFLVLKTRLLSSLPDNHEWEEYFDVHKISDFLIVPLDDFLGQWGFGKKLIAGKTSEMVKFRTRCRVCLFIVIVSHYCWRAPSLSPLYQKGCFAFVQIGCLKVTITPCLDCLPNCAEF